MCVNNVEEEKAFWKPEKVAWVIVPTNYHLHYACIMHDIDVETTTKIGECSDWKREAYREQN